MNADEIVYWNEDAGRRWTALADRIDAAFAPFTASLIEQARPRDGEAVLDIGCGCGSTTLEAAAGVGPRGRAVGLDVSAPMLELAVGRAARRGLENVDFVRADAAAHHFPPEAFDLALSRFGVMFFENPEVAFTNILGSIRPGGRLTFACWRSLAENPWFSVPMGVAKRFVPSPAAAPDPAAPGPLAFADAGRVKRVLSAAGFGDITVDPFDAPLNLGRRAEALDFVFQLGPASRMFAEAGLGKAKLAEAREAMDATLETYESTEGVRLTGGTWLVGARRPSRAAG